MAGREGHPFVAELEIDIEAELVERNRQHRVGEVLERDDLALGLLGADRRRVDRGGHEVAPDPRRQAAALNAAQRAVVVIADPYPGDEIAGEADEDRVAIVLAGAGLAECRHAQRGCAPGAAADHARQQIEQGRPGRTIGEIAHAGADGRDPAHFLDVGEAARLDREPAARGGGIGLHHLDQADARAAEREARLGGELAGDAEVARGPDHVGAADFLGQTDRGDVARQCERLAQADPAAIAPVIVPGRPVADRQRLVEDLRIGAHPGAQGGEIDEQFEGRAGLAARLGRTVEDAVLVALAADHRDHPAIGAHRDKGDLRLAEPGAANRAHREPLEIVFERGRDRLLAIGHFGGGARFGEHPVGEIGAGRESLDRAELELHRADIVGLGLAQQAIFHHLAEHDAAAGARALEVAGRCEPRRRLDQAGQHRRLADRQFLWRAAEIMVRGGAQPVDVVAEIGARHVAREYLLLGQPALEPEGQDHFLRLAAERALRAEESEFGELLGDRAAAFAQAPGLEIVDRGAGDADRVDAEMAVKAPVLDRDERAADMGWKLGRVDRRLDDGAAPRDRLALGREQGEARRRDRLERFGQRRGDREIGEQQDEDRERDGEDAPDRARARPARRWFERRRRLAERDRRAGRGQGLAIDRNALAGSRFSPEYHGWFPPANSRSGRICSERTPRAASFWGQADPVTKAATISAMAGAVCRP